MIAGRQLSIGELRCENSLLDPTIPSDWQIASWQNYVCD
jgi:hypothetical protein